jgi:FkbM family methyltransferase
MFAKLMSETKVLSIEPTKNAIQRLRRNIDLNGVADKILVFEGVASDKNGRIEIKTIEGKEEYSSLGEMKHPSIANDKWILEKVKSKRLDDLVEENSLDPGFLKIDVEGVEHMVFKGADKILSKYRPIILSELSELLLKNNHSSSIEVIDLLKSYDYDVFDAVYPAVPFEAKDFGDILCFPQEMNVQPQV